MYIEKEKPQPLRLNNKSTIHKSGFKAISLSGHVAALSECQHQENSLNASLLS